MKDAIYANAVIAVRFKQLLNGGRIRAMLNASSADTAAKVLAECGYNEAAITERDDILINNERAQMLKTFLELCDDNALSACIRIKAVSNETNIIKTYQDLSKHIPQIKSAPIRDFFRAEANFLNMRTYAKCRFAKAAAENLLVEGGTLGHEQLQIILKPDFPVQKQVLTETPYGHAVDALKKAIGVSNLTIFEEACADYLVKQSATGKDNSFTNNLLFHWYIMKQEEFKAVKTILMGKRLGLGREQIRENLGGLYDRFK